MSFIYPLTIDGVDRFGNETVGCFVFVFPKLGLSLDTCSKMVLPGIWRYISSL